MDALLPGAVIAFEIVLVIGLVKLFFDVAAIRRMLENTGLFSGVTCPSCRMPIPPDADVCGHCGRDVVVRGHRS
jgi:hypothetical protein